MNQESITPEQALKLIKSLKPKEFISHTYTNGIDKCCVMGHLARLTSNNPSDYSMNNCNASDREGVRDLRRKSTILLGGGLFSSLASVNNGQEEKYPQKTIKARVVAALKDIIKLEK